MIVVTCFTLPFRVLRRRSLKLGLPCSQPFTEFIILRLYFQSPNITDQPTKIISMGHVYFHYKKKRRQNPIKTDKGRPRPPGPHGGVPNRSLRTPGPTPGRPPQVLAMSQSLRLCQLGNIFVKTTKCLRTIGAEPTVLNPIRRHYGNIVSGKQPTLRPFRLLMVSPGTK